MNSSMLFEWLLSNWVEVLGTILGISYVFLSIKQNLLTWLLGFLTSALYIYVFFVSKFYADMALQFYYVWVSIYGWLLWSGGIKTSQGRKPLPVRKVRRKQFLVLMGIALGLSFFIYFILKNYTDSPVPAGDAFTTAFSIVATWMLARKILEHWLIWIVVNSTSLMLYVYKGLYPTSIMFVIYTIAAVWGYIEWKKDMQRKDEQQTV